MQIKQLLKNDPQVKRVENLKKFILFLKTSRRQRHMRLIHAYGHRLSEPNDHVSMSCVVRRPALAYHNHSCI